MVSIVCYLWKGSDPRRIFLPQHVTALARAFKRTLSVPHRFICVSDRLDGFGPEVEVIKTPPAVAALGQLQSPEGARFPSCYRRLWTFSDETRVLGERVLLTDIDLVVLKDMAPHLKRSEDFVGWRPKAKWGKHTHRLGGGMYLLKTGARTHVFNDFRGAESIARARAAGYRGSDQAWISYQLGKRAATWPQSAGLYSIRDLRDGALPLPKDAVAVQFNGPQKPWSSKLGWVRENFN